MVLDCLLKLLQWEELEKVGKFSKRGRSVVLQYTNEISRVDYYLKRVYFQCFDVS